jgi:predicted PurR-regulated permease PerM
MAKKPSSDSFTSFRIIGEKAQKLLAKAREGMTKRNQQNTANVKTEEPSQEELPQLTVHLSTSSVVQATFAVLAVIFGVLLVWLLQDKIVLLLLGLFVAILLDPGVKHLQRLGVPRGLGIILHYLVALTALFFLILSLIPIIADQIQSIAVMINDQVNTFLAAPHISLPLLSDETNAQLTVFVQTTLRNLSIEHFTDALRQMGQSMATVSQGSIAFAVYLAGSVLNFFVNLIVVLVLAFFFQLEKEAMLAWFRGFLPWKLRTYVDDKSEAITWKLGQWVRGQLLLCLCIGSLVFVALLILRMPYALTLALLAGFTEFIPVVGPLFAAIPAVLIGTTQNGFFWGIVVAAVYYVIQWCENNLIVPLIMKRAVGLSPTATMMAMMVGVSFPTIVHPILGVILSIPSATVIALFLEDLRERRRRKMGVV